MRCPKSGNYDLVIFRCFLNFGPFFEPFLGTVVKNTKHEKIAPGIDLNFSKNPSVNSCFLKMHFHKMYIFGAPIELTGPGMVSS